MLKSVPIIGGRGYRLIVDAPPDLAGGIGHHRRERYESRPSPRYPSARLTPGSAK